MKNKTNQLNRYRVIYGDHPNRLADGEEWEALKITLHAKSSNQVRGMSRFDGLFIHSIKEVPCVFLGIDVNGNEFDIHDADRGGF